VRLLSLAMTGYFYTFTRARTTLPMSMIKYDPISTHN
jgi:large subunit ribosomal protein L33